MNLDGGIKHLYFGMEGLEYSLPAIYCYANLTDRIVNQQTCHTLLSSVKYTLLFDE